jgi:hypothetical protein
MAGFCCASLFVDVYSCPALGWCAWMRESTDLVMSAMPSRLGTRHRSATGG